MDIVLLMIALSISTYLVSSIYYRYKKREILPNLIVLCFLWQTIAILIAYWFYYTSLYTMLNFPHWLNLFFFGILGVSVIAFVKFLIKQGISRETLYKTIGLCGCVFVIFFSIHRNYVSVQLVLGLNIIIYMASLLLLYMRRDPRQSSISFVQMLVGIIALSISLVLNDVFSHEYVIGIANGSIFLLAMGAMLYYLEHTTLDISDINQSLICERDISDGLRNRYDLVLGTLHEGIWEYDVANDRAYLSEMLRDFFKTDGDYLENAYAVWLKHLHPEDVHNFESDVLGKPCGSVITHLRVNGPSRWGREYRLFSETEGRYVWASYRWASSVNESTGTVQLYGTVAFIQDVRDAEEKSRQLAYFDQMTGLPNATSFYDYLGDVLQNNTQEHVLFLLDLDRFKYINDTRGHNFGNTVIQNIAMRLSAALGDTCTIFRYAGTEFIVGASQTQYRDVFEKIASVFCEPIEIGGSCIHLTASVGYCTFQPEKITSEELMMRLDLAKHKAKERGGDCQVGYSEAFSEEIHEKVMLSDALRTAVSKRELQMYYQPKVALDTKEVVGYEALLRWNLDGRWIPPDQIVRVAEETGQMNLLGRLIIEMVFEESAFLKDGQSIAINLSVMQLEQIGFLEDLVQLRNAYQIDSTRFIFEITESVLMQGLDNVIRTMHILRDQGFRISLDDFGTGYASYNYLARLPIDELKMDKSLTQSILNSEKDFAIVRHMIEVGQLLNCTVVCEGIELGEEYELLKSIGCNLGQGYYFSMPMPCSRFM